MTTLEADSFVLQSFDTLTGLKFFVTADPDSKKLDAVLHEVYELYSDYVLKVRSAVSHSPRPLDRASRPAPHATPRLVGQRVPLRTPAVSQNPFYENDMPIHCERFEEKLKELAEAYNRR